MKKRTPLQKLLAFQVGTKKKGKYQSVTPSGYVFDKRIFWVVGLCMAIALVITIGHEGPINKKYLYVSCPGDSPHPYAVGCTNPCYLNYELEECAPIRDVELLPFGYEYGKPPGEAYNKFVFWCISLIIAGFTMNHLQFNRGRKPWRISE